MRNASAVFISFCGVLFDSLAFFIKTIFTFDTTHLFLLFYMAKLTICFLFSQLS